MIQQSPAALALGSTGTAAHGFAALGVSDDIADVLDEQGITVPFPVQSAAIPEALRGGDILAKSPTGSGKTLAFAIPIVERLARARPDARARVSGDRGDAARRCPARHPCRRRLRRRAAAKAGAGRPR